ncbi:polyprenyl synthetase family protein [Dysgonomonas macrotermitis]|uniref:Geranylgeranyl diphosphate synthase, type II n=1 Tax=Dysgonomonas macrotermitis TaxID=1346286 RepID=A0A1M4WR01_9BACT|nr:polyprenyl synthetase family protein [Dysgonomonas macrotermitis]SHE83493.1 geranylgeranyl diphosphate synthase, type II [Dysgonomonas macrotermitis]
MLYTFSEVLEKVNNEVKDLKFERKPYSLFEPIEYILEIGGKRVRPVLATMAYNLYKADIEKTIPIALAIEIFHNFTLLHDDLMDRADKRRGKPTVHIKWNDNTAVLSGDAMLIEAYREIAKSPKEALPEILNLFTDTATEICCGQQLDMEFEQRLNVTTDEYLEMIRLKTAVLLACSLKCGAMAANAPESDADALYDFGINIGLAFQLMDDLLDVYGDPATFGKRIGGDILCNKKTYLQITALKSPETGKEMQDWINKEVFDEQEKIDAVTGLYNKLNLKGLSEEMIESYYQKGLSCLNKVQVDDNRKRELRNLAESLLTRKS